MSNLQVGRLIPTNQAIYQKRATTIKEDLSSALETGRNAISNIQQSEDPDNFYNIKTALIEHQYFLEQMLKRMMKGSNPDYGDFANADPEKLWSQANGCDIDWGGKGPDNSSSSTSTNQKIGFVQTGKDISSNKKPNGSRIGFIC